MLFPDLHRAVWKVAARLSRSGREDAATSLLRAYVRIRPRDPRGWINLYVLVADSDESAGARLAECVVLGCMQDGADASAMKLFDDVAWRHDLRGM